MDNRRARTKQRIFNAYRSLLIEVGYENIAIEDILEKAPCARSTFYSHFRSADDILIELCDRQFDHIFASEHEKEIDHDYSPYNGTFAPNQDMAHIFYHAQADQSLLRNVFNSSGADIFSKRVRERLTPFFDKLSRTEEYSIESVPPRIMSIMMTESFVALIRHWLDMGCISKPEHVAHFFIKTFRSVN